MSDGIQIGDTGIRVNDTGIIIADTSDHCCCAPCSPKTVASFTTNAGNPNWDLTPYQGDHVADGGQFWRLIELGSCYPCGFNFYGKGCVNSDGRLVGLPSNFHSGQSYDGHMALQIGCQSATDSTKIIWPGTCCTPTAIYTC